MKCQVLFSLKNNFLILNSTLRIKSQIKCCLTPEYYGADVDVFLFLSEITQSNNCHLNL